MEKQHTTIDMAALAQGILRKRQSEYSGQATGLSADYYPVHGIINLGGRPGQEKILVQNLTFPDGTALNFEAHTIGGGTANIQATGHMVLSPEALLALGDSVQYQMLFIAGGIGALEMFFADGNGRPLGTLMGISVMTQFGQGGGIGQFVVA